LTKPQIRKGYRKQRVKRPVEKEVVKGYDSNWEYVLHSGLLQDWNFHTEKVEYVIHHTYHPDFIRELEGKKILLEAKGRFWDSTEYSKYVWISQALPDDYELVFLFSDPNAPMPQANLRKDGTKRTHGEWASSKGFRWYSEMSIPNEWVKKEYKEEGL
jgi:hypothetical protein